ncbi:MAG: retropepsin-like domain-containing protein [Alphaproteobacteria bacterium]|nr:retropepsin-like domain-containing protein [Alphaproteobacteria bacterium]
MRMRNGGLILVVILAGLASPAAAADCGPLKQIASLDLKAAPGGGPRFGVPVTINGSPRLLLLNTQYKESRLTRAAVNALQLKPAAYGKMLRLDGQVTNGYMVTVDLGIGTSLLKGTEMLVDENVGGGFDGEFSTDLMQRYDIELDFTGRKLNYFLSDHCEGKVVYWPTTGFTTVPIRGWGARLTNTASMNSTGMTPHPVEFGITVSIDGHEIPASVETNLAQTTLNSDTAHSLFGLTADSPGTVQLGSLDGTQAHRRFGYVFKTLTIGGITLHDPHIAMAPDLLGTKSSEMIQADSHIQRRSDDRLPTLRIGMDVLRNLHMFIATGEQKLYLTLAPQPPGPGRGGAAPTP